MVLLFTYYICVFNTNFKYIVLMFNLILKMRKLGFILSIFALPLHTGSKCIISKVHPTTLSISHGIDRYVFATLEDKRNVQKKPKRRECT